MSRGDPREGGSRVARSSDDADARCHWVRAGVSRNRAARARLIAMRRSPSPLRERWQVWQLGLCRRAACLCAGVGRSKGRIVRAAPRAAHLRGGAVASGAAIHTFTRDAVLVGAVGRALVVAVAARVGGRSRARAECKGCHEPRGDHEPRGGRVHLYAQEATTRVLMFVASLAMSPATAIATDCPCTPPVTSRSITR